MRREGLRDWLWHAARLGLGFLFLVAAAGKLRDPIKFMGGMDQYGLVHGDVLPLGAAAMPGMELLAGLLLVLGWRSRAAATVISTLLLIFIGAMLAAMHKGLELDCSCFDLMGADPSLESLSPVLLNAALAGIGAGLYLLSRRPGLWSRLFTVALALWLVFGLLRAGGGAWARPLPGILSATGVLWLLMDGLLGKRDWKDWAAQLRDAVLVGLALWGILYKLSDGPSLLGWSTVARDVAMLLPGLLLMVWGPVDEA